jgi:tripartite-type tricarboxylate transporter receptor subunit TctC
VRVVAMPDYVEKIRAMAIVPQSSTPAELAARQRRDAAKLGAVIKAAGIKVQ